MRRARRKHRTPEQEVERSRKRLRFAVLDAKKLGLSGKEIYEIVTDAQQDWSLLNGGSSTQIGQG